jgi:cyclic pyranopterin monophosphate synthase
MASDELTHLDAQGRARMVDVTRKAQTERFAVARCTVSLSEEAIAVVAQRGEADPLASARVAGVLAAKRTSDFIPLCHPLLIGDVAVDFVVGTQRIEIEARVETFGQTGVEMEALTACATAALAISDICRTTDPLVSIDGLAVWEKRGGRSGSWRRERSEGLG